MPIGASFLAAGLAASIIFGGRAGSCSSVATSLRLRDHYISSWICAAYHQMDGRRIAFSNH